MYGGMNQRTSFVQFLPLIGKHFIAAIHYLLIIPGNNFFFLFLDERCPVVSLENRVVSMCRFSSLALDFWLGMECRNAGIKSRKHTFKTSSSFSRPWQMSQSSNLLVLLVKSSVFSYVWIGMHVRAKSSGVAHGTDKAGKCPTIAWGVEGAVVAGGMGGPGIKW